MANLKIGILTYVPRELPQRPIVARLAQAIERRGHIAVVAHHGEFHPEIGRSDVAASRIVVGHGPKGARNPFENCDAVIVRYDGAYASPNEFYLTTHLASLMPVVNPPEAALTLCNKFGTYMELVRQGLPCPRTTLLRRQDDLEGMVERLGGFPVIVKRARGARGRAVALAESLRSLRSFIDLVWTLDRSEPVLLQEFLPHTAHGGTAEDLRVWVIGGRVAGSARRVPAEGEFRANADLGAKWESTEATRAEQLVALRAAAALRAEYMGVDMMRTPEGPLLLDLNSNAEFGAFESVTERAIGDELVELVERRVQLWRLVRSEASRSPMKDRREALDYLYALPRLTSPLSPERIRDYLGALGHPEVPLPSLVVAGSNGKGTTAAMLERTLREAGFKTGLFTSPHLLEFEERIRIGGRAIPPDETLRLAREVRSLLESRRAVASWLEPCGFDAFLLMAVLAFLREGVDAAIFETGIGGECDATRGLGSRLVGIAQIDLEHTELLGRTREEILREKFGLAASGSTVVMQEDPELHEFAEAEASRRGATLVWAAPEPIDLDWRFVQMGDSLPGPFTSRNAGLARELVRQFQRICGCDIASEAIELGPAEARWPGRMTVLRGNPLILTDGAHTPRAIRHLADFLRERMRDSPGVLLLATAESKCREEIVAPLAELAETIVVTEASYRSAPAEKVAGLLRELGHGGKMAAVEPEADRACETAESLIPSGGWMLGAGGLFLTADLLRHYGIALDQL